MTPYLSLKAITAMHADEIQQAVSRVVSSGWYLQGEEVKAFEQEYAAYTGFRHCVSCANGLDALTLMLRAYMEMGMLSEGDEVIVPANTYIATILSISENRLKPVLVEPSIDTFQIDPKLIEAAITPRTRAVMIVHLYGFSAWSKEIEQICCEKNLLLLQDSAQAHGLDMHHHTACWSFYPGKNLGALGDAGAVTTDDDTLAETIRTLANYGSSRKYVFPMRGRNSRMDEVQAAVLRVKLRYLDEDNRRRREIAARYNEEITNPLVKLPPFTDDAVYHIYPVLSERRDEMQQLFQQKGIGTMIHYPVPPHKQDAYREWNTLSYPITELIHAKEISLPCNQSMTEGNVNEVINAVNGLFFCS